MAFGWRKQVCDEMNPKGDGWNCRDGPVSKSSPTVRNQLLENCSPRLRPRNMTGPFHTAPSKS